MKNETGKAEYLHAAAEARFPAVEFAKAAAEARFPAAEFQIPAAGFLT